MHARLPPIVWSLAIVCAVAAIYLPALQAPPIYDDWHTLVHSGDVLDWSVQTSRDAATAQSPLAGRPVARWSFVLTQKLGDGSVAVHRGANVLLHAINALLLLALLRELLPRAAPAGAIALLWAVHPLQTEAVMYITQRTELLAGTFYLLTLLASLRATRGGAWWWSVIAIAACALGMATKEIMVSAPLAVLLMDRAFNGEPRFAAVLRRHAWLYAGLAMTWLILLALLATAPRSLSVGFNLGVSALDYLRTQAQVIVHYLCLIVWPWPQLIHDDWPIVTTWWPAVWPGLVVLSLLAATLWSLWRRPRLGFAGACFFMVLAPTSSFVPIVTEIAAQRRMYLPLAVVLALVCMLVWMVVLHRVSEQAQSRRRRVMWSLALLLAAVAGWFSAQRAAEYHSPVKLWQQVLAVYPHSVTALNTLGNLLRDQGDWQAAQAHYQRAAAAAPTNAVVLLNLAQAHLHHEQAQPALDLIDQALTLGKQQVRGYALRAEALTALGRHGEAQAALRAALQREPGNALLHTRLGTALAQQGQRQEALHHLREALRLAPTPATQVNLAALLLLEQQPHEAAALCEAALQRQPDYLPALVTLGQAWSRLGQLPQAIDVLQRAVRQSPDHAAAHLHLGIALGKSGRLDEAVRELHESIRLEPDLAAAHFNLAIARLQQGDRQQAAVHLQRVLELEPGHEQAAALLRELREGPGGR